MGGVRREVKDEGEGEEDGRWGGAGRQGERVKVFLQRTLRSVLEVRAGTMRQGLRAVSSGGRQTAVRVHLGLLAVQG